jgi:hypothetical protein
MSESADLMERSEKPEIFGSKGRISLVELGGPAVDDRLRRPSLTLLARLA